MSKTKGSTSPPHLQTHAHTHACTHILKTKEKEKTNQTVVMQVLENVLIAGMVTRIRGSGQN